MRRIGLLLTCLLLAGCVNESASYYVNGNEHTLTLRVEQDYFWDDQVTLKLAAARLPDCQRLFTLGKLPVEGLAVELFSPGDQVFTVRAGTRLWQVETQNCTLLPEPAAKALGEPLGVFRVGEEGMRFEPAATASTAK